MDYLSDRCSEEMMLDLIRTGCLVSNYDVTDSFIANIINMNAFNRFNSHSVAVYNLYSAYLYMFDTLNVHLTPMYLKELHLLLMSNSLETSGCFRDMKINVRGSRHVSVFDEVSYNISIIDCISSVEEKAIKLFKYIYSSALFEDGNCRLALLLMNKVLIENNVGYINITRSLINEFNKEYTLLLTKRENRFDEFLLNGCLIRFDV